MIKKLFSLFITFFKIGLFTFGGGYAMISLIQTETVTKKSWLKGDELLDIIAIAESTPGPIAINCATYIGYKRAGIFGSFFATLGVVLPSFLIIFAISFFIERFLEIELVGNAFKGIQAAVAVLIVRAGFKMAKNLKGDVMSFVLFSLALVVTVTLNFLTVNFSSIYLIIAGGLVGFVYYSFINKPKPVLNTAGEGQSSTGEGHVTGEGQSNTSEGQSNTSEWQSNTSEGQSNTSEGQSSTGEGQGKEEDE